MPLELLLSSGFVYDCLDAFGRRRQGLVCNPQITLAIQPDPDTDYEGCLSPPGASAPVSRPDFEICQGPDQFGESVNDKGTGPLARCLQHETDHVNGIVMEDHLSASARHVPQADDRGESRHRLQRLR